MRNQNRIKTLLGSNIRKYREAAGMSQETLAEKIGCNSKYLSDLETGRSFASSELLEEITRVLDVPVSFLFKAPGEDEALIRILDSVVDSETLKLATLLKNRIREI